MSIIHNSAAADRMIKPIHISLEEPDFKDLVSGKVVKVGTVEITLKDIGFAKMRQCIEDAEYPE